MDWLTALENLIGTVASWIGVILHAVIGGVKKLFGKIGTALDKYGAAIAGIDSNVQKIKGAFDKIQTDFRDLKDWKPDYDPSDFDTKVIWGKHVLKFVNDLKTDIINVFKPDRFHEFESNVKFLVQSLQKFTSQGEPPTGTEAESRLGEMVSNIGEVLQAVNQCVDSIVKIMDMIDMIDSIKKRVQTLDGLFLPQSNERHKVSGDHRTRIPD